MKAARSSSQPRETSPRPGQAALLHERAAEDDLRGADLVQKVDAALEEGQSLARETLGLLEVVQLEMDGGERPRRLRGLFLAVRVERGRVGGLQVLDRLLGLPQEEIDAAEVVQQAGEIALVIQLLVNTLRLLRIVPGEHPVALALGDERGLHVDVGHRRAVVERLRELERALDVLARGLEVALAPVAARAVGEDVRAEKVAGKLRALRERVGLVEKPDCGGDARELVPADADAVEHLGAVEVGEVLVLDDCPSTGEEVERLAELALLHPGPRLAREEARFELGGARGGNAGADLFELGDGLFVAVRLRERLGTREGGLDPAPLVGGDAVREVAGVDVEPACEPGDRVAGRARLATLDLDDVLLGESRACELGLRHARGDAKLTHTLAEPKGGWAGGVREGRVWCRA